MRSFTFFLFFGKATCDDYSFINVLHLVDFTTSFARERVLCCGIVFHQAD